MGGACGAMGGACTGLEGGGVACANANKSMSSLRGGADVGGATEPVRC